MSNTARVPFDELEIAEDQSSTWQGRPFQGIAYEVDGAGRLVWEVEFENGFQSGMACEWYESGQLRSKEEYAHGSRHGYSKTWHANGALASDAYYQYSIKTKEKAWSDDGLLTADWHLPEDDEQHRLIDLLAKRFASSHEPD